MRPPPRILLILAVLVLLAGVHLRFQDPFGHWVWQDELMTLCQVYNGNYDSTLDGPLYPGVLRVVALVSGWDSVDGLRITTMLLSSLLPLCGFLFVRRLDGPEAALLALVLFSFLEYMLRWSANLRPYTLFMILTLAVLLFGLDFLEGEGTGFWLGVCVFASCLTHLLALQTAISLWFTAVLLGRRCGLKRLGRMSLVMGVAGALGVLWLAARAPKGFRDAILGPADMAKFLHMWFTELPIGGYVSAATLAAAWALYLVGLFRWYHKRPSLFLLTNVHFVLLAVTCALTIGGRTEWYLASRYFSHFIVLAVCVVAVGAWELIERLSRRLDSPYPLVIVVVVGSFAMATLAHQNTAGRWQLHDRAQTFYRSARVRGVGLIMNVRSDRAVKNFSLLSAYAQEPVPLYFVRGDRTFRYAVSARTDLSGVRTDVTSLPDGLYLTNLSPERLQASLNNFVLSPRVISAGAPTRGFLVRVQNQGR